MGIVKTNAERIAMAKGLIGHAKFELEKITGNDGVMERVTLCYAKLSEVETKLENLKESV